MLLALFRDFKEVCRMTIAYPPPAAQKSETSYSRLTSQKPTGAHDIIKLQYTEHEVHTAFCNAAVVGVKVNCGLSDSRGWRDGTVDCCLPSIGHDY